MQPFSKKFVERKGGSFTPVSIALTPSGVETVSGTINISATVTGSITVAGVQFVLNGANIGSEITTAPYTTTLNTTAYATGSSYSLMCVVRDTYDRKYYSDISTITIDNTVFAPDLVVKTLSYSAGVFTCTVKNEGNAATPAGTSIGVAYHVDGTKVTWGTLAAPSGVAAGATITIGTQGGNYTIPAGTFTISAIVDDLNTIPGESNEGNNTLSQSITISPPASNHKWVPGHYIMQSGSIEGDWSSVMSRIDADTSRKWEGVAVRLTWPQLERAQAPQSGVPQYDNFQTTINGVLRNAGISRVKQYRDQLWAKQQRKLIIFIHVKMFGGVAVPNYLMVPANADSDHTGTTSTNYMGQYKYTSNNTGPGGYVPNMHVAAVKNAWIAMVQNLAAEFDNDPAIAGIIISEQSISKPTDLGGGATCNWSQASAWFAGMTEALAALKTAFANTPIVQWINADRCVMNTIASGNVLTGFVKDLYDLGIGVGMPDICPDDTGLMLVSNTTGGHTGSVDTIKRLHALGNRPNFSQFSTPALIGSVAAAAQVTPVAFPGVAVSRQTGKNWAKTEIFANYMLWIHRNAVNGTTYTDGAGNTYTLYPASDSISGNYAPLNVNTITDNWIHHASSDISVVTTRPDGW